MLLTGNHPSKINSYGNILSINYLSYVFKFQLVPFAFGLILGDPSMVSPCPLKYRKGDFFPKNKFHGEKILRGKFYRGIFLHGGTNDQFIPRGKELQKTHFPVI